MIAGCCRVPLEHGLGVRFVNKSRSCAIYRNTDGAYGYGTGSESLTGLRLCRATDGHWRRGSQIRIVPPFQGSRLLWARVPRALPWAILWLPLRGEKPDPQSQGVALGYIVAAPSGRKKPGLQSGYRWSSKAVGIQTGKLFCSPVSMSRLGRARCPFPSKGRSAQAPVPRKASRYRE